MELCMQHIDIKFMYIYTLKSQLTEGNSLQCNALSDFCLLSYMLSDYSPVWQKHVEGILNASLLSMPYCVLCWSVLKNFMFVECVCLSSDVICTACAWAAQQNNWLWTGSLQSLVSDRNRDFYHCHHHVPLSGSVNLTIHLFLVRELRMYGAVPQLSYNILQVLALCFL